MNQSLIVMCGAPGSGKSTLSRKFAEKYGLTRYSMDELGMFEHKSIAPIAITSMQNGNNVIVDALYTDAHWREELLASIKDVPCKKILLYLDVPLEECLRRNAGRENPLPEFIVEHLHRTLDIPTKSEGWDEIYTFNEN